MTHGGGSWSFQTQDLERLQALLSSFVTEAAARCVVLLDRNGQLLTLAGDGAWLDGTTFASLAAADFAASDQLAALLGEREFAALYHQGERGSMYLADVAGRAILATLFDDQRTTLGMIRLRSRTVVPQCASLIEAVAARRPSRADPAFGNDWYGEAEDEIDRLFAE